MTDTSHTPVVSVVLSVHNGETFLRESVQSVLVQTFRSLELIIVDDGSTDDTARILEDYAGRDPRVLIVTNPANIGLTRSLNRGLSRARGRYIARHDADDVSRPDRLTKQVAFLEQNPDAGLLGSAYDVIDASGAVIATHQHPTDDAGIRWRMLFHNAFCHTSVMFRSDRLGPGAPAYDETLACAQDYGLWARLLTRTKGANLASPLVARRVHDDSIAATRAGEQQAFAMAIAARQLSALAPDIPLSMDEVALLGDWYHVLPNRFAPADVPLARKFVRLASAFENGCERDRAEPVRIGRRVRLRVQAALEASVPTHDRDARVARAAPACRFTA